MGCGKSKNFDASDYLHDLQSYDQKIQPVIKPTEKDRSEIIESYNQSISGTKSHRPEMLTHWDLGKSYQDFECPTRRKILQFFGVWQYTFAMDYGTVYTIRDPDTQKIVAGMFVFPPGAIKSGKVDGVWRILKTVYKTGWPFLGKKDEQTQQVTTEERCKVIKDITDSAHKLDASVDHYFLKSVFVRPGYQNLGYGTQLLQLFNDMVERDNQLGYVQVVGDQNRKMMQKYGFEVAHTFGLQEPKKPETLCEHKFYSMVKSKKTQ